MNQIYTNCYKEEVKSFILNKLTDKQKNIWFVNCYYIFKDKIKWLLPTILILFASYQTQLLKFKPIQVIYIIIVVTFDFLLFLCLDTCRNCDPNCPSSTNMLSTYRKFITFSVIPEIKRLLAKYSVWWRFKPNSLLKEYLKNINLYLTTYFNPKDLYDSIQYIVKFNPSQFQVNEMYKLVQWGI